MWPSLVFAVVALISSSSSEPILYRLAIAPAATELVAPAPAAPVYGASFAQAPIAQQYAQYAQFALAPVATVASLRQISSAPQNVAADGVAQVAPVVQVAPIAPVAQVAPVAPAAPAAVPTVYPSSSVSAYSYGYNVQDYQLVNPPVPAAYSLPYAAYSADWYYRK